MNKPSEHFVTVDLTDPNRGRFDRERFENPLPDDEEYPDTDDETFAATMAELAELRRRRTPKQA